MTQKTIQRPRVACEFSAARVTAARASNGHEAIDVFTSRPLRSGALQPSVLVGNVTEADTVKAEVKSALEAVAGSGKDLAVIVPDAAVRVSILDFDQLPESEGEAREIVRLRFRRNVPFEAEDAAVGFQRLPSRAGKEVRVLAVAMPRIGLEGYEQAVRDAGYLPGFVIPATLASLGAIDISAPCMVVRHTPAADASAPHSTTIAIVSADDVLLYRTIESTGAVTESGVLDDVYSSLVFYEDNFGGKLTTVYLDGVTASQESADALRDVYSATLRPFPQASSGQNLSGEVLPAGVLSPLEGALLGRALAINLATQPFEDRRAFVLRWGALTAAVAAITLVLLGFAVNQWRDRRQTDRVLAGIAQQHAETQRERQRIENVLNEPQNRGTRDRAQFLNALILRKTFSWTAVFSELEHVLPPSVRVTAIRPEVDENNHLDIRLSVESDNRNAALEFIKRIESTKQFRNPQLLNEHHGQNEGETVIVPAGQRMPSPNAVTYEIQAEYQP